MDVDESSTEVALEVVTVSQYQWVVSWDHRFLSLSLSQIFVFALSKQGKFFVRWLHTNSIVLYQKLDRG